MTSMKLLFAAAALGGASLLSACDDGYGYPGVSLGYGYADYDPYYGSYRGDPYWGWYGDYYYPGTGYYVYDRDNRRHRWNDAQRGYWQGRSQQWRNGRRPVRPMWRDFNGGGQGRGGSYGAGYAGGVRGAGLGTGPRAQQGTQSVQSANPGVARTAPNAAGSGRGGGWRGGGGNGGGRSGGGWHGGGGGRHR